MQNTNKVVLFDIFTTGHHGYYALNLAKYLNDKGIVPILVTFRDERTESLFQNSLYLKIEYIGGNPHLEIKNNFFIRNVQLYLAFKKCFDIAEKYNAKIVHVLYLDHNIIPLLGAIIIKRYKFSVLGTLFWPYFIKGSNKDFFHKLYYQLTKKLLKYAMVNGLLKGLFVHTDNIKKLLLKGMNLNVSFNSNIIVVPDPSLNFYNYCSKKEARSKLGLPQDENILLYFGVLTFEKGIDILLNAIKTLDEKFKLVIAGRPVYFNKTFIDKFKNSLSDPERIISHLDYIPEDKVPLYFISSDVVILPYRKTFLGTSGVLQQACGAGKPVIVSNVGEVGYTVKKFNLGIVVEPESVDSLREGIKKFLSDKEYIQRLASENALRYAQEHSIKRTVEKIYSTYLSLL